MGLSLIDQHQINEVIRLMKTTPTTGVIIEVGVYKGGSAVQFMEVAKERGQELWLFDTFDGVPEAVEIDHHKIGDFNDCSYENVKTLIPDAKIFKGIFPETWHPGKGITISFAHIDCDQYTSISKCIKIFKPLMLRGGIMWFDDYGWPWLPGAKLAVDENLPERLIHPLGRAYYIF